ncbi:mucin-like protein isoform X2 [Pocillopora verrucosa]|uniref:mucin-like protein isoform X2 n=1 Tax=Pocillopora verrucosa TaxID=203993 RepID=UPI00334198CA
MMQSGSYVLILLIIFHKANRTTSPPVDTSNVYPFGPQQNDSEFRLEDSRSFSSRWCLRINTDWKGFPFFSGRHYKLHICRDGKIQLKYEWSWWWPQKFGIYRWFRNMAVIAPFWATTDTYFAFKKNHSRVYYQVYEESKESSSNILDMAAKHVQNYTEGFSNFQASWVLVVTWENLCPYVYYPYYYYYYGYQEIELNCRWNNTFQAVIITDGFNTFLMYNYPHNGIQWVVPADHSDYRYWTGYYGLPTAGWNAGNDGQDYLNIKGSGTLFGMYNLDKQNGNTGSPGKYFWRIENNTEKDSLEKCMAWSMRQRGLNMRDWYDKLIRSDWRMACPCTEWQAWLDWGRFSWDWWSTWPDWCYESRRVKFIPFPMNSDIRGFTVRQQCCYSTNWDDWGSLKVGPPDGGHVKVDDWFNQVEEMEEMYTDRQAYQFCCVDTNMCEHFYFYRPSDHCSLYRPPLRRWFWGDPHIKTLDDRSYTFNGLGEFVMVDANEGQFQLQARTKRAQGNNTKATIFSAGAAKEENTSTIEIRVKPKGGLEILLDKKIYHGYNNLIDKSIAIGGNLSASAPEKNCLQVSFPSTTSVNFCVKKEMLSFVVSLGEDLKNTTKGLLGTWNDNPDDDFTRPDGTVLKSFSLRDIHFSFGVKWQINQSQSLFTYGNNESVASFSDPDFEPMFADNITWHNDSLRQKAEDQCGNDQECLFDVASTNDLSLGLVTKDISIQLVNETKQLNNFPPKIETVSNAINATLGDTVHLSIRAVDNDTIKFRVINNPEGATWNQTGNLLYFTWLVTTSRKFSLTFVASNDKGASASWSPIINMCACQHDGQCVKPEEGDTANTDSKFVYMGCACQGGYTGRFCDSDIDACEMNGQPCYAGVACIDLPAPANSSGYKCGPCPSGYTGNGAQCADIDECQNKSGINCDQLCVNLPGSYFCDCNNGYKLNADGGTCDDINECLPTNDCMQKCNNTRGSYSCSCDNFFQVDPSDPKKCVAINPCPAGHGCQHVCFTGDDDELKCTCDANYELDSDGISCRDIDECDPSNPRHRCSQICKNTPGSYNCSCEKGFEITKDGYDCEDINECLDVSLFNCTDEFHKCVNTRGSYKCECDQDLYFIDGKCRGLEKNQTAPVPELQKPREPSNKEKEEAVQFSIEHKNGFKWDFKKDKDFNEKMASVTTKYCSENRTRCALKETTRSRRPLFFDLYTTDQIHLLPDYPTNSSGLLYVAFYVQQPVGQYVSNASALPHRILVQIIVIHKGEIEAAIGANISGVVAWFKPGESTSSPTVRTAEPDPITWKWIAISAIGGGVVLVIVVIIVWRCLKRKRKKKNVVIPTVVDDTPGGNIAMKSNHQSVESLEPAPSQ